MYEQSSQESNEPGWENLSLKHLDGVSSTQLKERETLPDALYRSPSITLREVLVPSYFGVALA